MLDLARALDGLDADDLFPVWCWVDGLEERGVISPSESQNWKNGVIERMLKLRLSPEFGQSADEVEAAVYTCAAYWYRAFE